MQILTMRAGSLYLNEGRKLVKNSALKLYGMFDVLYLLKKMCRNVSQSHKCLTYANIYILKCIMDYFFLTN